MIASLSLRRLQLLVVPLTLVALISSVHAGGFSGPVVSVLDGDTIEVLHNQHPERIRLSGIDCPEKGQAYGQRAKQTVLPAFRTVCLWRGGGAL
jgi:micrococcal nuclease